MLHKVIKLLTITILASLIITACSSNGAINPQWANYQTWQKGNSEPITGVSPFLGNLHRGSEGYRNIYINDIGAEIYFGEGSYEYPEGTIVVKDQASSLQRLQAGNVDQTIMVKLAEGSSPQTNDWGFARKLNDSISSGDSRDAVFCGACHQIPATQGMDYLFTNGSTF